MTAQEPADRVHVLAGEKFATPLLAQFIVPVGEKPVTVAVHVV